MSTMSNDKLVDSDEFMNELYECEDVPTCSTSDIDQELDDFWNDINSDFEEMDKEEKRKEELLTKPDSEKTADQGYENGHVESQCKLGWMSPVEYRLTILAA